MKLILKKDTYRPKEWNYFKKRFNWNEFSCDFETNYVSRLTYYNLETRVLSLYDGRHVAYLNLDNYYIIKDLKEILKNKGKGKTIIAHNIVFEAKCFLKLGIDIYNANWRDSMGAYHFLNEESKGKKGLKNLAKTILNVSEEEIQSFDEAYKYGEDSDTYIKYSIKDSIWCWELWQIFKPQLKKEDLYTLFTKVEMPFLRNIVLMETTGVKIDQYKYNELIERSTSELYNLEISINRDLGGTHTMQYSLDPTEAPKPVCSINIRGDEVKDIIFNDWDIDPVKFTDKGNPSLDADALGQMKHIHEVFAKLSTYKKSYKLSTSFLKPMKQQIDKDGRLRGSFNSFGTVTGRLSSSKPNFQQLPRPSNDVYGIRSLFKADEGYKMIACDFSSQENVVIAHISDDQTMKDIILRGGDMHLINANAVFELGIPYEKLFKSHPEYKELKEKYYEERNKGKVFTYSIPYGAGVTRFMDEFSVSKEVSQSYLDKYYDQFKGIRKAMDKYAKEAEKKGCVTMMSGRKRRLNKDNSYKAFNSLVQGFCSDMTRVAMNKVLNLRANNPEWDLQPVMAVHDEAVYLVKEEYAEEAGEKISQAFSEAVNLSLPTPADYDIGDNYGEAK